MNDLIKLQPQTIDGNTVETALLAKFTKTLDELYNTYPFFCMFYKQVNYY